MVSSNESVASVVSEDSAGDAIKFFFSNRDDGIMKQILEIQESIHQMAIGSLWNSDGVAKIEEIEDDEINGNASVVGMSLSACNSWEMLDGEVDGDPSDVVDCGGIPLDGVLTNVPELNVHKQRLMDAETNETLSTGSVSTYSALSLAKSTTFIHPEDDNFSLFTNDQLMHSKDRNGKKGKRHLRALAKLLDPKMDKKVKNRRGVWSGCYDDQDKIYEQSIEIEFGREPLNPKYWRATVDPKSGKTYYYHSKTKEVTWSKPEGFNPMKSKHWRSAVDPESGMTYYYNSKSKIVTWSKPQGFKESRKKRTKKEKKKEKKNGTAKKEVEVKRGDESVTNESNGLFGWFWKGSTTA